VLAAVDEGTPREEVARTFSVSVPSIKRWLKRRRPETGDVEPKPIPGRTPIKGAALKEWLPEHLKRNPDLTLEEQWRSVRGGDQHERLRRDDEPRRRAAAGRVAAQKKSPLAQEERDEEKRDLWRWLVSRFDVRRLWCSWTRAGRTPRCRGCARGPRRGNGPTARCPETAARTPPS